MMISSKKDYQKKYQLSIENPNKFWSEYAKIFKWKIPFRKVLNWNFEEPKVEWFCGGKLNIT